MRFAGCTLIAPGDVPSPGGTPGLSCKGRAVDARVVIIKVPVSAV